MVSPAKGEALDRRLLELHFLEKIVRASAATRDHHRLLRIIVDETTEATGTEVCSIYLWDDPKRALVLTATNGLSRSGVGRVKLALGEGITGWVAAQRQPLAIRDVRYDSRFKWVPNFDQEQLTSMVSVPVVSVDRLIGVINVQTVAARAFSDEEVAFLSAIAAQIAGIIDLSQLHHNAVRDLELARQIGRELIGAVPGRSGVVDALAEHVQRPIGLAKARLERLAHHLGEEHRHNCEDIVAELDQASRGVSSLERLLAS